MTASSPIAPWLARWEAQTGPAARRHLADRLDRWREELTSDDSPFRWWGTAAEERAAWHEVKRWPTGQSLFLPRS